MKLYRVQSLYIQVLSWNRRNVLFFYPFLEIITITVCYDREKKMKIRDKGEKLVKENISHLKALPSTANWISI